MGAPEAIRSHVPNFVNDVPRVPKYVSRWGSTPNTSLWVPKWNYVLSMFDWGLGSNRIRCTKFNEECTKFNEGCTKFCEGCTKFCKWCTKGSKVCSEVGIGPKSLSYVFLNEIMDNPCSDGGPESDRTGYTKFNERCTKFCERCTKGSKVRFKVGIDPQ